MTNLYQFSASLDHWPGSPPIVCVGPVQFVVPLIDTHQMAQIFGGYVVYVDDRTGTEYVGVWGARKVAKFRRLLLERGGSFILREGFLPGFRQKLRNICR